ncbi:MAG: hypothetical protein ACAI43_08220 [Phycisphaerae bacterium]
MADLDRAIALAPSTAALYFQRGYTRVYPIDYRTPPTRYAPAQADAAMADYAEAIRLDPRQQDARRGRFILLVVRRDLRAADDELVRWLADAPPPGQGEADLWRGVLLVIRGRDAEARAMLEPFLGRHPHSRAETERDLAALRALRR